MKHFSALADLLPEPLLLVDPQSGAILQANSAAQSKHELDLGTGWLDRVEDRPALLRFLSEASRVRVMLPGRLALSEPSGERIQHRVNGSRFSGEGPRSVLLRIGVSQLDQRLASLKLQLEDAQESLRARQRALMLEQRMQETQKLESLGVLAGGIAHDFNNLLVGVVGNIGLARTELPPASRADPFLSEAERASQRAAELCRQLLAYSGRGRVVIETLDVSELVQDMAQLVDVSISKRAVVRRRLAADLPAIEGDATQLRQVLLNLLTNAAEALEGDEDGVITLSTSQRLANRSFLDAHQGGLELPAGRYVEIEVSDTGAGMDSEVAARIFEPFYSTKATGRGLGLAAVRGILRSHGGALRVYTEPGRGTAIRLLLPALKGAAPERAPPPVERPLARISGRILVIDDQAMVRTVSARALGKLGVEVLLAEDGEEGLELYHRHRSEIWGVLLDLTMPKVSGAQVFKEMRRVDPELRIVLTSGYSEDEIRTQLAGRQPTAFLEKPWTPADLQRVLEELMDADPRLAEG